MKVGDRVKIIGNSAGHCYIIGEEFIIEIYHPNSDDYQLRYIKLDFVGNYIGENDMIVIKPILHHICGLICKCNAKEAVRF